ncbi:MAG: hypothetical protein EBX52_02610 [Proteobacteria bacterium]|nr:hypothetical protein [Pseudomonadota bacterium]
MEWISKAGILLSVLGTTSTLYEATASAHPLSTSQSECTSVDLREDFPVKMRNQNGISWCYAHAAADLLQFTYRIPEQISAADIAINYAESDASKVITFFKRIFSSSSRAEPPQTGFIRKAIKKTLPEGYCPESFLPSDVWTRVDAKSGNRSKVAILDAILDSYQIQKKVRGGGIRNPDDLEHYYEFPHVNRDQFFDLARNSKKASFLYRLRGLACSGERKPYPGASLDLDFQLSGRRVFKRINSSLSRRSPVGLDFFSGIFEDYDHYKRKLDDLHTVLLYGRNFDAGLNECVYLMKNSYGEDCSRYDPKIKCEKGYLWFPESRLYHSMVSILRIEKN